MGRAFPTDRALLMIRVPTMGRALPMDRAGRTHRDRADNIRRHSKGGMTEWDLQDLF